MKKVKQSFAILLAFVMVFTLIGVQMPVTVQAATKVAFSCTKKTVAVGGKYTLTVKGVKDKKATYAWFSSNKKVATVSKKGVVSGVAEGSATIKCKITLSDKSTKTLSCKVTVKEQIAAKSVKISNAKLDENEVHTIVVGESYDFNRKLSPSKSTDKTYWYILDEEYAEVDSSGVVTAKKAGITTLVAKVGIDRVSAEESTNKVVDSIRLNIVSPTETSADKFTYTLKDDGTVCITSFDKSVIDVVIPNMIEGKVVTEIGEYAFSGCSSLTSVEIPDSVTDICDAAFYCCSSLTSIKIPKSVTSIGRNAFGDTNWLLNQKQKNPFVVVNGILIAVDEDKMVGSIEIPDSVTSIGAYVFYGCDYLESIEIPDSVMNIDAGAFSGCSNLTSIEIPDGIMYINKYVFAYCSSLTSIEIPDSVTIIDMGAFRACNGLTSIKIPDSVTYISDDAFETYSDLTLTVNLGSYAAQWAIENNYEYEFTKESLKALGDNPKWAKAYLEYLMGEAFAERYGSGQYGFSNLSFHLLYLDEDDVPELILEGENPYTDFLLCYNNAKVQQVDSFFGLMTRYVPYSGWLETTGMDSTRVFFDTIDRWSKQGGVQSMADGVYAEADNGWGNTEFKCNWDGKNYQNREEYEAAIDAYWIKQGFELSELKEISYYGETRLGNYDETIQFLTQELKKAK